ncbi:putative ADP-ribosylation factor family protein 1, partial [Toxoplasma gondii TgCatPRC2]
AYRCPFSVV